MVQSTGAWTCCPQCGRNEITVFNGHSCNSCGYQLPEWMRAEFPLRNIEGELQAQGRQSQPDPVLPLEMMGGRREAIEKLLSLHKVGT